MKRVYQKEGINLLETDEECIRFLKAYLSAILEKAINLKDYEKQYKELCKAIKTVYSIEDKICVFIPNESQIQAVNEKFNDDFDYSKTIGYIEFPTKEDLEITIVNYDKKKGLNYILVGEEIC